MPPSILLINGPNLNLLGTRQPELYGSTTLADVESRARTQANALSLSLSTFQSNHEGALIDRIHDARGRVDFILINAACLTHTSVGLRDALIGVDIPFVEIHVTNVHRREKFRHVSYLSDVAVGVVAGLGTYGYVAALDFANDYLMQRRGEQKK
jgi:3-dehydroquinate dehydratase-2